jgi:7,8-dihydropterin-6-yl-methyl-4-(beta-D-ribofuranosyl)aminobenzene 5'-phosphate synthase
VGLFSLADVDGHKILYDSGASADMIVKNAAALHVDFSDVEDVILSHNHWDHVGGLMAFRRTLSKNNPRAMSRVHVGARIFEPRLDELGQDMNWLWTIRTEYLATGGTFIVHDRAGAPTERGKELESRIVVGHGARARGRLMCRKTPLCCSTRQRALSS